MENKKRKAFTLVELIIVITILAILRTIGFMSYQTYTGDARDSNRIATLKEISNGLEIYQTKNGILPIPDEKLLTTLDVSGNTISYQGYAGTTIQKAIKMTNDAIDPKDNTYYTYSINGTKTKYQLLTLLEKDPNLTTYNQNINQNIKLINQTYARIDYTLRYPYTIGNKVGIFFTGTTNQPYQETLRAQTGTLALSGITTQMKVIFTNDTTNSGTIISTGSALPNIIQTETKSVAITSNDNGGTSGQNNSPTGVSFYNENINHKFNNKIIGQKLDITTGGLPLAIDNNYIYNNSANEHLYRWNKDGTNMIELTSTNVILINVIGNYIYYREGTSYTSSISRMNLDGTNKITLISSINASTIKIKGNYIFYVNASNYGIYRMNLDGSNLILLNSPGASQNRFEVDDQYVYFQDSTNGFSRINLDGTGLLKLSNNRPRNIRTNSSKIIYRSSNSLNAPIYIMNKDGSSIITVNSFFDQFEVDANYLYYNKSNGIINRIKFDGTGDELILNAAFVYGIDNNYVYGLGSGNNIYRSNILNTNLNAIFTKSDAIYTSSKITIPTTNNGIYINVGATLAAGTSYIFELANNSTEQVSIPEGDMNVNLMSNRLSYFGMDYNLPNLFAVGDIVKLYKAGQSDLEVTISSVSSFELRFTTSPGVSGSRGVKKGSSNFKVISNSKLDGTTLINLVSEFGTTTTDLYYRITLNTTDNIQTPVINNVELLK